MNRVGINQQVKYDLYIFYMCLQNRKHIEIKEGSEKSVRKWMSILSSMHCCQTHNLTL